MIGMAVASRPMPANDERAPLASRPAKRSTTIISTITPVSTISGASAW